MDELSAPVKNVGYITEKLSRELPSIFHRDGICTAQQTSYCIQDADMEPWDVDNFRDETYI